MDYVPLPLNPVGSRLAVPLLTGTGYDNRIKFADYPQNQGWGKRTASEWTAVFARPTPAFQAFLQRWLLFYPLQAFSGRQFALSELTHVDIGTAEAEPEVTLLMLPQSVEQWLSSTHGAVEEPWRDNLGQAMTIQQLLSSSDPEDGVGVSSLDDTSQYTLIDYISLRPGRKDPCHPLVSIAISSLLSLIRNVIVRSLTKMMGKAATDRALNSHCVVYQWRSPIWKELLRRGWCPFELTPMAVRFNTAGLAFMARVEPPMILRVHKVEANYPRAGRHLSHQDSQLCSSFACVHRRIPDSSYTTAHAHGCSGCTSVVTRLEDMALILKSEGGSFPLVACISEHDEPAHARLVPWKPGVRYIAISHVWSDGLGNVIENGIPRCQLQRLSSLVRTLLGSSTERPLFWLDTLCVPPDAICVPPEASCERELQNLATAKMRDTYAWSTATLVLDAWLFSTRSAGMTDAEKMMRIFSSAWNSRLWTYQEGALPRVLYFQFEDKAEDLDQMRERLESDATTDVGLNFTLVERLLFQHNNLRGFRQFDSSPEDFILFVLSNMSFRSTSVATDEALCLSSLMGLDMDAILCTPPELRMAAFWRQVPYAPSSLLLSFVPTLDQPGLSWAPYSTLLIQDRLSETGSLNTLPDAGMSHPTKLTARGLEIKGPGLVIHFDNLKPEGQFLVKDDLGFYYHIRMVLQKTLNPGVIQRSITVLVVHSHNKVEDCVQPDGMLQPLLLMLPSVEGFRVGRKCGIAHIRRLTPDLDEDFLKAIDFFQARAMPIDEVGVDPENQMFKAMGGQNLKDIKWCVA